MTKSNAKSEAAIELGRVRAQQKAREKRRRVIVIAASSVVVLGLAAVVTSVFAGEIQRNAAIERAASEPIEGVAEPSAAPAVHVESVPEPTPAEPGGTVLPPTGGEHDPVVQNCGVYTAPVATAKAVHSLEHGAVWITYQPGLDDKQIGALTKLAENRDYTLLSPMDSLGSPVVLTAWGTQLEVDDASDPRVEPFLVKYLQGEQTPEPGAPCTGGFGDPA
ncbi:DUF3105 domain-containing protein [Demequina aurantiaca]|uniref:DUF3105 domain-containing protein n=1 Tax=Demequina aurantiaca TaxID=676200 RepID=UPI003D348B19